jgi:hypothetical protein
MVQQSNGNSNETLRPSAFRRKKLQEDDSNSGSIPTVSNFFSLERYYDASDKVLLSFQTAFKHRRLDEAYVYGVRYSRFCMEGITKHDYFNSEKFKARRIEMGIRVSEVIGNLEQVAEMMDVEEMEREAKRKALLMRQKEEQLRKQRLLAEQQLAEFNRRMDQQKASSSTLTVSEENLEESAFAKLQRLTQPQGAPRQLKPVESQDQNKRVSWSLPAEPDGQLMSQFSYDSGDLPPALLPPTDDDGSSSQLSNGSSPPSYSSILKQSSFFGPGRAPTEVTQPSAPSYDQATKISKKVSRALPIRQIISHSHAKHRELLQCGRIQVSPLRTYQGRVSGSTNGCTVISACCVSRHMETQGGITDQQVNTVIDRDCVPLLRSIRNKLDLGAASLIIPSDVHDYLVDHKLLYQHKFIGAAGGNIVDPDHAGGLIKLLHGEAGKTSHLKAAATLFFREHVVSIVKFPTSATDAVYDMIDSLPTCNGQGSRTRCHGLEALKVHLVYYCTRKFSDSNITYIERNKWDDMMADFDPRVFQAFVWADLPEPRSN